MAECGEWNRKIGGLTNALWWEADFKPRRSAVMSFSYADRDLFDCNGVDIGFLKEFQGMRKYLRLHTADKTLWHSVDSKVIQPFGPEPVINRKIEQSGNFMRVTTDVLVKSAMSLEFLKIDTLSVRGEWEDVTVYYQASQESFDILFEKIGVKEINDKGISFKIPPLAVVFTDKNGVQLEIGLGYDLWRWNNAVRFCAENRFVIKKEGDCILFERVPILWDHEHEIQKFNFRFSWYFAWGKKSLTEQKVQREVAVLNFQNNKLTAYQSGNCDYKFDYSNWPETTMSSNSNEPCFASRQTKNILKDFLRKALPKMEENDRSICLHEVIPHICSNSKHMERSKPGTFVHWDYWDMIAFWAWANNFFAGNDKQVMLIPDSQSPLSNLPSFRAMSEPKSRILS